eukprot:TRINITY_DN281_c0_g2_i1.p1 TRINITY_DN281_c0_g2~~TRINITY_DN281_c0_g2_i1.p1  ORF type:complete len:354 (-),score=81.05 TRINITY_DN281_c0_g2_i1:641-1702(-)
MCFRKKTEEEIEQSRRNRDIEAKIKQEKKKRDMKLLLLGTGDSGKSTFAKQMRRIYKDGFSKTELEKYVDILRDNCLSGMKTLIKACLDWKIDIPKDLEKKAQKVLDAANLTPEIATIVKPVFQSSPIQKAFLRANELNISGGAVGLTYYVTHAERFADENFLPTEEDALRVRVRTTGMMDVTFDVNNVNFTMVDVGGQRSERRKWIHCFSDVQAVIFLAALSDYDMFLEEDPNVNRMEESLKLFEKLSGSTWFSETSFILFLNKSDVLKEKITTLPLSEFFEDYTSFVPEVQADDEYTKSCEYLKHQFVSAYSGGGRLYPFITCAIDKENCERVFRSVQDTVINVALNTAGL